MSGGKPAGGSGRFIPICPKFALALHEYWSKMGGRFHCDNQTRPWTLLMDAESLGLDHYPVMDDMVAAMILPDKEIVGKVPRLKPGPERVSVERLQSTFGTLSIMARLVNAATMLQSYLALLTPRLPGGGDKLLKEATEESRLVTMLQMDLARANGHRRAYSSDPPFRCAQDGEGRGERRGGFRGLRGGCSKRCMKLLKNHTGLKGSQKEDQEENRK
ncbi:hypothetical protein J4Q44_G00232280 [Coregonus suidteri]|uniref:Uncharacterized protein n=1 Tax=Coregonus suidteri TaxID=861788 RepID=A0AAN8QQ14_9TELE